MFISFLPYIHTSSLTSVHGWCLLLLLLTLLLTTLHHMNVMTVWKSCFYAIIIMLVLWNSTVVAQAYKVDVEVLSASRGCTAILRCVVPTFVKELVRVVSWVHEPAIYIYPSLQGGKYVRMCDNKIIVYMRKSRTNQLHLLV